MCHHNLLNLSLNLKKHITSRKDPHVNVPIQELYFRAYHFLQMADLPLLVMYLLVLHLQNLLQALKVLLNVLVRGERILKPQIINPKSLTCM